MLILSVPKRNRDTHSKIQVGVSFISYKNDKGETTAMRLGLAKGPVAAEKIIYFGKYE
jgi:hypothetical protein